MAKFIITVFIQATLFISASRVAERFKCHTRKASIFPRWCFKFQMAPALLYNTWAKYYLVFLHKPWVFSTRLYIYRLMMLSLLPAMRERLSLLHYVKLLNLYTFAELIITPLFTIPYFTYYYLPFLPLFNLRHFLLIIYWFIIYYDDY